MTHLNDRHDDRLEPGLQAQAGLLQAARAQGATQLGWKAGFGTTAARATFGLDAPLVGFLLDASRRPHDARIPIGDWTDPRGEAELAMRFGVDVPGDATPEEVLAAIDAVAPAIELVDLSPPPTDPVEALTCNLYHRHWITGDFDPARAGGDLTGLVGHVTIMGSTSDPVTDLEALTGDAGAILAEVARMAALQGRGLLAGDVVILGSIVPPAPIAAGGTVRFSLSGHPPLEVTLVP
jgi:2-keto-4-pentenoate hydratase